MNRPYPDTKLTATGGTGPFTWTATGLPTGLSIGNDGTVSGTPSATGTFDATATVTDHYGATAQQHYKVTINSPPSVTTTSLPGGQAGQSYSATVAGSGGTAPLTWSAQGLPPGLSIASTGQISGTPLDPGTFSVTVKATDAAGAADSRTISVDIGPGALSVTGTSPNSLAQDATANVNVTGTGFVNGGSLDVSFANPDVTVNSVTFVSSTLLTANVTVSPTAAPGATDVTVTNGNGEQATATNAFTVNVGRAVAR